jgi:hypothetical protein
MTPERFRHLTEAYGALPERWPRDEREAARALIEARDPEALAALAEARALDSLLDAHKVEAPSAQLISRIVASAAKRRPFWRRPRVWFSGVGFVGAGAAGMAVGALIVSMLAASPAQTGSHTHGWFDQSYSGTAFGAPPDDWSDQ